MAISEQSALMEAEQLEQDRIENGNHSRSAVQKRIDRLTGTKYKLRQENQALRQVTEDLQQGNQELRTALVRALSVIDRLRGRRNTNGR